MKLKPNRYVLGSLILLAGVFSNPYAHAQSCGIISTVAGNDSAGYSGDGGAATAAELYDPLGVTVDASGNLYIADQFNTRIRKVTPSGIISTVAGGGTGGLGDGGAATAAELHYPSGVAVDASGNLYIADYGSNHIRKVTPSGIISTVAGNGTGGYSGDGGAATAAELHYPTGVTVDASGNLYIADLLNNVIRKVTPSGIISTAAGNGTGGYLGDGTAATAAELNAPFGVAVDASGNFYIADRGNYRIRKVAPSGIISTVAGNGTGGYWGDGGAATAAQLYGPSGVAVDATGNLYIADGGNQRIRKVTPSGTIGTVAGNGTWGYSGDGGAATAAGLYYPNGVAVDASGNLYIADEINNAIRKVGTCNSSVPTAIAEGNDYAIYPNPTSSILNIVQTDPADVTLPTAVMNFLGQTVFTGEVAMRGGKGALDVSNLVPGIYVVVFRTPDGGREQFKVVVE